MSGYIKGIIIEIDGEIKGLDAALKKINTTTRSLQGDLKRVNSLLKLNPGNADLVRQKQKLLAQSITQTKTKLDALRQAQVKMKAKGIPLCSIELLWSVINFTLRYLLFNLHLNHTGSSLY